MLELILRIGFSLLVVFGLMWGLARLARKPLGRRGGAALTVLARQQLGRSSSVAVVRVVDRALVLGVTEGQVTLLGETDLAALERQVAAPATGKRSAVPLDTGSQVRAGQTLADQATPDQPATDQPATDQLAAGRLHGSALSPATWRQTVDFLRERTARR